MPEELIVVYATDWCWDCLRALRFLDDKHIPYRKVNIDRDREGEEFVLKTNKGMRSVPTIVLPDGRILVEPSNQFLEEQLTLASPE